MKQYGMLTRDGYAASSVLKYQVCLSTQIITSSSEEVFSALFAQRSVHCSLILHNASPNSGSSLPYGRFKHLVSASAVQLKGTVLPSAYQKPVTRGRVGLVSRRVCELPRYRAQAQW